MMLNNMMAPYPGNFGPSVMPTQPVMPTSAPGMGYNPYAPNAAPSSPQPEFDWIRVPSLDDLKNVVVQPNGKAWVMLQNEPIFAVKTADAMGLASTQIFRFEPYTPQTQQAPAQSEFAPLSVVQQMQAQLQQLTTELDALKGGTNNGKPTKQSVPATANGQS